MNENKLERTLDKHLDGLSRKAQNLTRIKDSNQ